MLAFLLGVPGKCKTLTDRLSSARAALLDNLDAAVSTRAPSTTALTNATWTDTRAGYLDALASIPQGIINRIQTGFVNAIGSSGATEDGSYVDTTITAVVTSKSIVYVMEAAGNTTEHPTARLTSTTNVRVSIAAGGTNLIRARWYVVEFK